MKTKINWKKFIVSSIVIFIAFVLVADILFDSIFKPKEFDWNKIFGFENLFWKVLAAIVGAYFYSSESKEEKK